MCIRDSIFMENMAHGSVEGMSFFEQVSGTMMVTIWVFLGIDCLLYTSVSSLRCNSCAWRTRAA